jgi:hypothetical protein
MNNIKREEKKKSQNKLIIMKKIMYISLNIKFTASFSFKPLKIDYYFKSYRKV